MKYSFSNRISGLQPSAIREILKFTADKNVVSLAAGNPSPDAFPTTEICNIANKILQNDPITALQYGVSEGYLPLRECLLGYLQQKGVNASGSDSVLVTTGSQQAVDLAAKVFCNEGDTVLCEAPSFIGSLNTFRSYGVHLVGVPVDDDGINIECLESALKTQKNVKMIYTIPNFQNPTGVTMAAEKRQRLYELAVKHGVVVFEDDPYGDLRAFGSTVPPIKALDKTGAVIYSSSFSKILSPGLRVGFVFANAEIAAKMTVGKQASDVHTPVLNQMIVHEWLAHYDYNAHIEKIRQLYKSKLELMCSLLDEHANGSFSYKRPDGGIFLWCRVSGVTNTQDFASNAAKNGVAVVPGSAFLVDESQPSSYIRLNYSTPTNEQIAKGIKILCQTKGE